MLPEPEHAPTGGPELPGVAPIAGAVGRELATPEGGVTRGAGAMPRAAMPEATIDEDGPTPEREDEVRAHLPGGGDPAAHQESVPPPTRQTFGAEDAGQGQLGGRIAPGPHLGHQGAALGDGESIGHAIVSAGRTTGASPWTRPKERAGIAAGP